MKQIKHLWIVFSGAALFQLSTEVARAYYNPQTGRWLSRDPIGEEAFLRQLINPATIVSKEKPAFGKERGSTDSYATRNSWILDAVSFGRKHRDARSTAPSIIREVMNSYGFLHEEPINGSDALGLSPCSYCSEDAVQGLAVRMGREHRDRSVDGNREYGGLICCNQQTAQPYAAKVVEGPGGGYVNMSNSKCQPCDIAVADWHTHPDVSTQLGSPGQFSSDLYSVRGNANVRQCDWLGYMTKADRETTVLTAAGVETVVDPGD